MDPSTQKLVDEFNSVLKELTFNSRPLITSLTKLAEENISCANYFVELIENRIDKIVPSQKLFTFYALDSICKNAGSPYTIFFSKNLFNLFKKTYLIVDNNVRTKLINLFKSWLKPLNSTGEPVFEKSTLDHIEKFLIKASVLHQKNFESMLPKPTVPLLLKEIDRLNSLTLERLKNSPNDTKLLMKLDVLGKLKDALRNQNLSLVALKQVQLQLRQVFAQDQYVLQENAKQIQRQQQQQQQIQQQQQQLQQQQQNSSLNLLTNNVISNSPSKSGTPIVPLFTNNNPNSSNIQQLDNNNTIRDNNLMIQDNNQNSAAVNSALNFSTLFGNVPSNILDTTNILTFDNKEKLNSLQNLYQSLKTENLLYEPPKQSIVTLYNTLINDNKYADNNTIDETNNSTFNLEKQANLPKIPVLVSILNDCNAYFSTINVSLSNAPTLQLNQMNIINDNKLVQDNFIHYLYRAKPNKCNMCGKRFGITQDEKNLQSDHLDWHFRINKRIKGTTTTSNVTSLTNSNASGATELVQNFQSRNIQSRNWYLVDSQWINFNDDEIVSVNYNNNNITNRNNNKRNNNKDKNSSNKRHKRNTSDQNNIDTSTTVGTNISIDTKTNDNNNDEIDNSGNNEHHLMKKFVIVPESLQDPSYKCPICQEKVTSKYDDDTGEWIWPNTVEIDGKYFHATCYGETTK